MKIHIKGVSCSGKSTLSKKLSHKLNIPHIELDNLHWLPGWKERNETDFANKVTSALSHNSWIVDGNYNKLKNHIDINPDYEIWLDFPLIVVLFRCLKRTFNRVSKKIQICNGNTENIKTVFSSDSMFLWILKTYKKRKTALKNRLKQQNNIFVIKNNADYEKLLIFLQSKL